ncbi:MAG: PilW family protein [Thermodesulfovibrionales bacterium]
MSKRQNRPVCRSQGGPVLRQSGGFTLVELMITMIIFILAITAASQIFVGLLTQFKQQSKIAETNIEGVIGLELLRADIEQAGFGLPRDMNGVTYVEAVNDQATWWNTPSPDARTGYNDNNNPPRAIVIGPQNGMNNSDILVVKATNVATSDAAHKSTYVADDGSIQTTGSAKEDLLNTDWVIALFPDLTGMPTVLLNGGVQFTFNGTPPVTTARLGAAPGTINLVYGISPAGPLRMPFNRADYYIRRPTTAGSMPARCAPGTGVLYKATLNHADGKHSEMPLLDCVVDMQVVFGLDTNGDKVADFFGDIPVGYTAQQIRDQVIDVRVYIVAQEGQIDTTYTYKNSVRGPDALCDVDSVVCINYTNSNTGAQVYYKAVDVSALPGIGTGWKNYRWKLYTLVAKPYFSLQQ